MIEIRELTKTYQTGDGGVEALKNISLTIQDGDIYGVIGMSGAGKSTLVRCINMLERPTRGAVLIDGQDMGSLDPAGLREARRRITMIFQSFNLLMQRNCLSNICFPLRLAGVKKEEAERRAMELLELVGLPDKAKAYPAQLSGGQQQRVAIARALATDPKILLCDEATSALDPNTTKQILDLLKKINREMGVTVIVITHEMAVIEAICDRVAIIDQSHIAEVGGVSEIFSNPKTDIGRRLILGDAAKKVALGTERQIRIIFDGRESSEPVISNLVLACKVPVNIMHAETKDVGGKAMGHMLIQIPEDETEANRVINYLKTMKVTFEEVR